MTQLTRIYREMRRQPVIGLVTLFGTALAIFLIMIVVLMQNVNTIPFSPESNRGRFLHGRHLHMKTDNGECSGGMSYQTARTFVCDRRGGSRIAPHRWRLTDNSRNPRCTAGRSIKSRDRCLLLESIRLHIHPWQPLFGR